MIKEDRQVLLVIVAIVVVLVLFAMVVSPFHLLTVFAGIVSCGYFIAAFPLAAVGRGIRRHLAVYWDTYVFLGLAVNYLLVNLLATGILWLAGK